MCTHFLPNDICISIISITVKKRNKTFFYREKGARSLKSVERKNRRKEKSTENCVNSKSTNAQFDSVFKDCLACFVYLFHCARLTAALSMLTVSTMSIECIEQKEALSAHFFNRTRTPAYTHTHIHAIEMWELTSIVYNGLFGAHTQCYWTIQVHRRK